MRWVVVAALAVCLARAAADEYGGARMPQYDALEEPAALLGGGDYRGHSPDASAPLDYKYEEDSQGNTEKFTKEEPARIQRGLRTDSEEPTDSLDAVPLYKSSFGRWPPRHRARPVAAAAEPTRRRRSRRGRRGRVRDYDFPVEREPKTDYRVDKHKTLENDDFPPRVTTELTMKKKPRNRFFDNLARPQMNEDLDLEPGLIPDRSLKNEELKNDEDIQEGDGGRGGTLAAERPLPPPLDDDEEERPRVPSRFKEYSDYDSAYAYDARRLPMLVRRTTTRSPGSAPPPSASPSASTAGADLLAMLWTARRARPAPSSPPASQSDIDPHSLTTKPPETTTATLISPTSSNISEFTTELSIAEKSRLSILKKSLKKENDKGDPSRKPPVLLLVTSKMATVVMVEPPTRADPWMGARRVSGDSPQKLEKVKRLMRHKLVAGAKSIQELTDNWDDLVCDYIDVSLLDEAAAHSDTLTLTWLLFAIVFVVR